MFFERSHLPRPQCLKDMVPVPHNPALVTYDAKQKGDDVSKDHTPTTPEHQRTWSQCSRTLLWMSQHPG